MSYEDKYKNIIEEIKRSVEHPQILKAIDSTPCFARLWRDEVGICPEKDCAIRAHCKLAYEKANGVVSTEDSVLLELTESRDTYTEYDKLRVTGEKYHRGEYVSQGRPVDEYVAALVHSLNYPPVLPKNWSYKTFDLAHSNKGPLLISKTVSYHAFLHKGVVICRFWTNAAGSALVDISAPLSEFARRDKVPILDIPKNSYEKLKPCIFRIKCNSSQLAETIANWIKEAYDLK